jgi:hypothetical protein
MTPPPPRRFTLRHAQTKRPSPPGRTAPTPVEAERTSGLLRREGPHRLLDVVLLRH